SANGLQNVKIFGRGTIDCRGAVISGGIAPSTVNADSSSTNNVSQLNPIWASGTNGITIDGVACDDSTGWTIDLRGNCTNMTVTNLKLINRQDWQWNDGIDITSSNHATVSHCFVKTCDDAACVKIIGTSPAYSITEDDVVDDTGVGCGFRIGNEAGEDIHDVTATHFNVLGCHRGIDLTHWGQGSGSGLGTWYNIHCRDFRVEKFYGSSTSVTASPTNSTPGNRGSYLICPLRMETDNKGAGVGPIHNVEITRCTFDTLATYVSYLWGNDATNNVSNICLTDVKINGTLISGFNSVFRNMGNTANITFNTNPNPVNYEGENLARTPSGCSPSIYVDSRFNNGESLGTNSTGVGQYVDLTLPSVPAGTYDVKITFRGKADHGQYQGSIDGINVGAVQDQYLNGDAFGLVNDLGEYTFYTAGTHTLRILVTGKNGGSSGYQIGVDTLTLSK